MATCITQSATHTGTNSDPGAANADTGTMPSAKPATIAAGPGPRPEQAPGACYSCHWDSLCPLAYLLIGPCSAYEQHRSEE
jgi:hypothetical protein